MRDTEAALKAAEELAEEAHGNGNDWELFCMPRLEVIRAALGPSGTGGYDRNFKIHCGIAGCPGHAPGDHAGCPGPFPGSKP